jgi:hypothetical protein
MTRIAVILSLVAAVAACDVGSVVSNNQGGPDGSIGSNGSNGSNGSAGGSNCEAIVTDTANLPNGHHNAGMTCMTAGCHLIGNAGAGAPEYSYAGTLYKDTAGTQPYAGATIIVTVGGTQHKVVTSATGDAGPGAGNFFIAKALATPPTAAMTGQTAASACPNTTAMTESLVDNGGNCNNCHRTGGTTLPLYVSP